MVRVEECMFGFFLFFLDTTHVARLVLYDTYALSVFVFLCNLVGLAYWLYRYYITPVVYY